MSYETVDLAANPHIKTNPCGYCHEPLDGEEKEVDGEMVGGRVIIWHKNPSNDAFICAIHERCAKIYGSNQIANNQTPRCLTCKAPTDVTSIISRRERFSIQAEAVGMDMLNGLALDGASYAGAALSVMAMLNKDSSLSPVIDINLIALPILLTAAVVEEAHRRYGTLPLLDQTSRVVKVGVLNLILASSMTALALNAIIPTPRNLAVQSFEAFAIENLDDSVATLLVLATIGMIALRHLHNRMELSQDHLTQAGFAMIAGMLGGMGGLTLLQFRRGANLSDLFVGFGLAPLLFTATGVASLLHPSLIVKGARIGATMGLGLSVVSVDRLNLDWRVIMTTMLLGSAAGSFAGGAWERLRGKNVATLEELNQ